MNADIKWLSQWIEEYESEVMEERKDKFNGIVRAHSRGKQSAIKRIKQKIDQLDETEVLSREWIDDNSVYASSDGVTEEYVHVEDLQNLIVPDQLPTIPKYVAEVIEEHKEREYNVYFSIYFIIEINGGGIPSVEVWVAKNIDKYARAWLYGYTIEKEQLYFAKIKGHENISSDDKYWNYCITDESLDIGDNKVHDDVLAEYVLNATKDEWGNLGINDDNADFVEVEALEE